MTDKTPATFAPASKPQAMRTGAANGSTRTAASIALAKVPDRRVASATANQMEQIGKAASTPSMAQSPGDFVAATLPIRAIATATPTEHTAASTNASGASRLSGMIPLTITAASAHGHEAAIVPTTRSWFPVSTVPLSTLEALAAIASGRVPRASGRHTPGVELDFRRDGATRRARGPFDDVPRRSQARRCCRRSSNPAEATEYPGSDHSALPSSRVVCGHYNYRRRTCRNARARSIPTRACSCHGTAARPSSGRSIALWKKCSARTNHP